MNPKDTGYMLALALFALIAFVILIRRCIIPPEREQVLDPQLTLPDPAVLEAYDTYNALLDAMTMLRLEHRTDTLLEHRQEYLLLASQLAEAMLVVMSLDPKNPFKFQDLDPYIDAVTAK